jgi:uncharacterized protein YggE
MAALWMAMLALCSPALAQSDAISTTVMRTVDLAPDRITFSLAIMTDTDVSLEQVLQAAQSLGLVTADLRGISSQQFGPGPNQTRLAYSFEFTAEFSKFKEINDKLAVLRRTLAANASAMEVQIFGITVSPSDGALDQARQGLLAQLFADSRQRAEQLAKAGGVSVGSIVGVSDGFSSAVSGAYYGPYGPSGPVSLRTTFSLTVRYSVK